MSLVAVAPRRGVILLKGSLARQARSSSGAIGAVAAVGLVPARGPRRRARLGIHLARIFHATCVGSGAVDRVLARDFWQSGQSGKIDADGGLGLAAASVGPALPDSPPPVRLLAPVLSFRCHRTV